MFPWKTVTGYTDLVKVDRVYYADINVEVPSTVHVEFRNTAYVRFELEQNVSRVQALQSAQLKRATSHRSTLFMLERIYKSCIRLFDDF